MSGGGGPEHKRRNFDDEQDQSSDPIEWNSDQNLCDDNILDDDVVRDLLRIVNVLKEQLPQLDLEDHRVGFQTAAQTEDAIYGLCERLNNSLVFSSIRAGDKILLSDFSDLIQEAFVSKLHEQVLDIWRDLNKCRLPGEVSNKLQRLKSALQTYSNVDNLIGQLAECLTAQRDEFTTTVEQNLARQLQLCLGLVISGIEEVQKNGQELVALNEEEDIVSDPEQLERLKLEGYTCFNSLSTKQIDTAYGDEFCKNVKIIKAGIIHAIDKLVAEFGVLILDNPDLEVSFEVNNKFGDLHELSMATKNFALNKLDFIDKPNQDPFENDEFDTSADEDVSESDSGYGDE